MIRLFQEKSTPQNVLVFLIPASALTTSFGITAIQVAIMVVVIYLFATKNISLSTKELKLVLPIMLGFAGYFALSVIRILTGQGGITLLDRPFRFFVAISCIFFVAYFRPSIRSFWLGLYIGGISAGVIACTQKFYLNAERVSGFTHHPITFGNLSLLFCLLAGCSIPLFRSSRFYLFPYIAVLGSALAVLLSGSRGSWLAIPFVFIPLFFFQRRRFRKTVLYGLAGGVISCLIILLAVTQTTIAVRFKEMLTDIQAYQQTGDATTSVGIRLELFKASWIMFLDHPWVGGGRDQFVAMLSSLAANGRIQQSPALLYASSHNDSLYFLATGGVLDFTFLLLIYFSPLLLFLRALKNNEGDAETDSAAMAGVIVVLSYIAFGLTDVMFWLMYPTVFYTTIICILAGFVLSDSILRQTWKQ